MTPHAPDGISEHHARRRGRLHRHASPISLVVLGLVIAWALSGQAGSSPRLLNAEAPAAVMQIRAPAVVRNGEFMEQEITVTARRPIAALALEVDRGLWREITVNTTLPGAEREGSAGGRFRFEYGALAPGQVLELKFELQSNPSFGGRHAGVIALLDGAETLLAVPMALRVLP